MKSNRAFVRNLGNRTFLVAVTSASECRGKSLSVKQGLGYRQTAQNAVPDQGLHGLLKLQEVKG